MDWFHGNFSNSAKINFGVSKDLILVLSFSLYAAQLESILSDIFWLPILCCSLPSITWPHYYHMSVSFTKSHDCHQKSYVCYSSLESHDITVNVIASIPFIWLQVTQSLSIHILGVLFASCHSIVISIKH